MTVSDLYRTAGVLASDAPVLIYLDMPAKVVQCNGRAVAAVEGYFAAEAHAEAGALILLAGRPDG